MKVVDLVDEIYNFIVKDFLFEIFYMAKYMLEVPEPKMTKKTYLFNTMSDRDKFCMEVVGLERDGQKRKKNAICS